jgi:hypothetical protein
LTEGTSSVEFGAAFGRIEDAGVRLAPEASAELRSAQERAQLRSEQISGWLDERGKWEREESPASASDGIHSFAGRCKDKKGCNLYFRGDVLKTSPVHQSEFQFKIHQADSLWNIQLQIALKEQRRL